MSRPLHPRLRALEERFSDSPLLRLADPEFERYGVELWIKRDDVLHPVVSGNKWRKLKYILDDALDRGADTLVGMGGAYSNHLHALAYAGRELGLNTQAWVRGERPSGSNPTLTDLENWGMALRFVSREDYRQLRCYKSPGSLPGLGPGQYWLPEGGAAALALRGVGEIVDEIAIDYDTLVVACGTGTTLAGLLAALPSERRLLGVSALKGGDFLYDDVRQLLPAHVGENRDWQILLDYHHGGFAKTSPVLLDFIVSMRDRFGLPLEPVYTGKTLYAIYDLMRQGYFKRGQRIVFIHSGGLQGTRTG